MRSRASVLALLLLACSDRKGLGEEEVGAGTGDSTGLSSSGDAMETGEPADCQPILQGDGTPSGFEMCMSSGDVVRVSAQTCFDPKPPSDAASCVYGVCMSDADCAAAPHGACQLFGDLPPSCMCTYGCTSDDECGPGFVCMCAPVDQGTICIEAACRTDADCDEGLRCTLSPSSQWGARASLACG
jgi:hypothetical protein